MWHMCVPHVTVFFLPHHLLFLPLSLTDSAAPRVSPSSSWRTRAGRPCTLLLARRPRARLASPARTPPPEAALLRVARPPRTHARAAAAGSARCWALASPLPARSFRRLCSRSARASRLARACASYIHRPLSPRRCQAWPASPAAGSSFALAPRAVCG